MIVIGIVLIVIVLVVGCVFVKCIVPGIGKLKNRMFVEESNEDKKDDSIPIPPSSDRNRI